jgi:Pyruvate/2-oxoacid:ferredoxin oxidoreductase delta subunit
MVDYLIGSVSRCSCPAALTPPADGSKPKEDGMNGSQVPCHYVCTHEEARKLVEGHKQFWVSNCGCREQRGQCARSRMDVCLAFNPEDQASGSGKREATVKDARAILDEAADKHLVARPFRNKERTATDGICFCCDDCCGYFLNPEEKCDKGDLVAVTDLDQCTDCGECVPVCHFGARAMEGDKLAVDPERCYGCGLCASVCPLECIEMVPRA